MTEYSGVRSQPLSYQDDIVGASSTTPDARAGIMKMEAMIEVKLLNFYVKNQIF